MWNGDWSRARVGIGRQNTIIDYRPRCSYSAWPPAAVDHSRKESATAVPSQRDDKLIALIAEAFEARKLVDANPDKPIASVAGDHGKCRTRLGKLVRLSCLAPDIVTAIVKGRQPKSLTAKSLSNVTLPLAWDEQRKKLGFG